MRDISKLIIHCSDSAFGDAALIDTWHKARGFTMIGYHYVILNGYRKNSKDFNVTEDGIIERGRKDIEVGAHCEGENHDSLGVCLILSGGVLPTSKQEETLKLLVKTLCQLYNLKPESDVFGHYEFDSAIKQGKTCPGFKHDTLLELIGVTSNANAAGTD